MIKLSKSLKTVMLATAASVALSSAAIAGEAEDALIAKVVDAYGGERLTNLKSIRVQDEYKTAFPGQGYTSGYVEYTPLKQDAQIDLANERGSVEGWGASWNFTFNTRTVSVEDNIVTVNYNTGMYQPAALPDYYTAYGAVIRVTDTLLAHELTKQADNAEYKGEIMYIGRPHEMISFEMPASPPVTLYVDAETGFISKMMRGSGLGDLAYVFGDYDAAGGVSYAKDFQFFVGPDLNLMTLSRNVSVNNVRSSMFSIDRGIDQEPARVDTSEMTIDEIADGVHLVGTGNAYTVFADAGDYIIGTGGYAGLADRFAAYKEAAGHNKPLRYQVATHHHTDHLGGMADAFSLGAIFVTPENAVANINNATGESVPEDRLQIIDDKTTLGPIEIYNVATNHAEQYALVYIPAAKAAFQADHYNGVYEDAVAPAALGSLRMKQAIDALGIDVDVLLSAHGRKAVPWEEYEAAVADYDPDPCKSGRPICR